MLRWTTMSVACLLLGVAVCGPSAAGPATAQEGITVTELPTLGGTRTEAHDINDQGQVVGVSETELGARHPFIWTAEGGMVDLGLLDQACQADYAAGWGASDVSEAGRVVGVAQSTYLGQSPARCNHAIHAFTWTEDAGMTELWADLDEPCLDRVDHDGECFLASYGDARAVSDVGHVVGHMRDCDGDVNHCKASAFIWTEQDGMAALPNPTGYLQCYGMQVNNLGQVAGQCWTPSAEQHVVVWMPDRTAIDLGNDTAWGLNDLGQVALGEQHSGSSQVMAISLDDRGNLYAGGRFSWAGGASASNVAKWDGSTWSALDTGTNSNVRAVATDASGNVYVGGGFGTAGGLAVNYIAKWDGTSWSALGSGMNGFVSVLATDSSGNVYAGGGFTTAGGVPAKNIAKWDGTSWSALGSGTYWPVQALAFGLSGDLYTSGDRHVAKWDGITWSALGTGPSGWVLALATDSSGNVYAGGSFTTAGGVPANNIAKWDGTGWSALGSGTNSVVRSLATDASGNVYAGGEFTTAGNVTAKYVAMWDGGTWSPLGQGLDPWGAPVWALAVDGTGRVYAGSGGSSPPIATWDGVQWTSIAGIMNRAARWSSDDGFVDLGSLGGDRWPYGLNVHGQVAGESYAAFAGYHAFFWTAEHGMTDLGTLGDGLWSGAYAVSDIGQVIGWSETLDESPWTTRAFSWMESTGMIELPPLEGHEYSDAYALNNVGQVIGESDGCAVIWSVPLQPPTPQEAIGDIAEDIAGLVAEGILEGGQANALTSKLDAALFQIDKGNENAAGNMLQAFVNQLTGLVNAGVLTIDDAQPLIDAANAIIDQLTGG